MATPWHLMDDDQQLDPSSQLDSDDFRGLASLGVKAVKSGKITVPQAKANAAAMKLQPGQLPGKTAAAQPPGAADASALTQNKAGWQGDNVSMAPPASPPEAAPALDMTKMNDNPRTLLDSMGNQPLARGQSMQAKQEDESKNTRKLVTTSNFSKDMDQARAERMFAQGIIPKTVGYQHHFEDGQDLGEDRTKPIYDLNQTTIDKSDPYQQQLAGIKHLEDLNQIRAQGNAGRNTLDLSPLGRLADYVSKSNVNESYKAPANDNDGVIAGADEIQKRRADLLKSIPDTVKSLKGGTSLESLAQFDMLKNMLGAGNKNNPNDPMALAEQRNAWRMHSQVVQSIKKDPGLNSLFTQYSNLNNAVSNMANAHNLTPQQFQEAQQAIRANLGVKGSSGVDERSKTMLENAGYNVDNLMQFLQAKPANISQNDPMVRHVEELAANEMVNVNQNVSRRLQVASGGMSYIYDDPRYAYLRDSIDPFKGSVMAQFQPTPQLARTQGKGAVPSPKSMRAAPVPAENTTAGARAGAPKGPQPGAVEGGYKFLGGDPKNPKSWEKQ